MSMPEALIFDVDGTLADTERDGHRVAFNLAFADAGLDWEWSVERYGELLAVTGGKERIRFYLERYNTEFKRPADFDDFVAGLHQAKTAHYTRLLGEGRIPLRPGVARLIGEARGKGVRLAIATTTTPANVTALLESCLGKASPGWFEVIAAGDVVPAKKPAPDIFELALSELGLTAAQCVAFEDSRNGLLSSRGAGLATVVTPCGYTLEDDFSGALLVIDTLGEPDAPFRVFQGDAHGHTLVDLDLVAALRS
ncbi:HAD family hydrolase [Endothiovibrio diazotrophicus]